MTCGEPLTAGLSEHIDGALAALHGVDRPDTNTGSGT
jgi:hypothetical protein